MITEKPTLARPAPAPAPGAGVYEDKLVPRITLEIVRPDLMDTAEIDRLCRELATAAKAYARSLTPPSH